MSSTQYKRKNYAEQKVSGPQSKKRRNNRRRKKKKKQNGKLNGDNKTATIEGIFAQSGMSMGVSGTSIMDEIKEFQTQEEEFAKQYPVTDEDEDVVNADDNNDNDNDDDKIFSIFEKSRKPDQKHIEEEEEDVEEEDDDEDQEDEEGIDFNDALVDTAKGSGAQEENINLDFEFFDPKDGDFHGLKALFRQFLGPEGKTHDEWNMALSDLCDIITKQVSVGTMIKSGPEEPPLAGISVLNLFTHKKSSAVKFLVNHLTNRAPKHARGKLNNILKKGLSGGKQIGFLLQDRLINLPSPLIPVLLDQLLQDLEWAQKNETPKLRKSFNISEFVYITRAYYPEEKEKVQGKGKTEAKARRSISERCWFRVEDEIIEDLATFKFSFPLKQAKTVSQGLDLLQQDQVVMVFPSAKLPILIQRLTMFLASES